ncbi:MAG: hypothetical protein V2I43_24500 [Parvularcula sp.]|jgi:hypothetical protein|nr:hypothetical protein [Parvularcula sp.]
MIRKRPDLAASTMAEIVIVFLFYFLILLASEDGVTQDPDRPPQPRAVISIDGTEDFFFSFGSAIVPDNFSDHLQTSVVPAILAEIHRGGLISPSIEVIGHTDRIAVRSAASNLDFSLAFLHECITSPRQNNCPSIILRAADNAGLGLARATATAGILAQDTRLIDYPFTVLSAGSLSPPNIEEPSIDSSDEDWEFYHNASRRIIIRVVEMYIPEL